MTTNKPIVGFISQIIGFSSELNTSFCEVGLRGKLTSDILTNQNYRLCYIV